jgi:hypothetical protein
MSDRALTFVAKLKALFAQRRADTAFDEEMKTALNVKFQEVVHSI